MRFAIRLRANEAAVGDNMNITVFTPAGGLYPLLGFYCFALEQCLASHGLTKRGGNAKRTELWRVAHLSTCVGGFR